MDLGLAGQTAVVVGGGGGLGSAIGSELLREGCNVALVGRTQASLDGAVERLDETIRERVDTFVADASEEDDVDSCFRHVCDRWKRMDILVNCAGDVPMVAATDLDFAAWQTASRAKFGGYLNAASHAGRLMRAQGAGVIVNVIGNSAREPAPPAAAGVINAALSSFTKALANDLAPHGVRVVAVNPGPTWTSRQERMLTAAAERDHATIDEMKDKLSATIPLGRFGEPGEVARVVAFLASPSASFVTGAALTVDGDQNRSITY